MATNLDDILRKLPTAERKKVEARAAKLNTEERKFRKLCAYGISRARAKGFKSEEQILKAVS